MQEKFLTHEEYLKQEWQKEIRKWQEEADEEKKQTDEAKERFKKEWKYLDEDL